MQEFVLIIRLDELPEIKFTPDEIGAKMKNFENWMGDLIARDILVNPGNRLAEDSRIIRNGLITNGPYVEIKEIIGGFIIIRANSIDEAAEIANTAPLDENGTIEVRKIYSDNN